MTALKCKADTRVTHFMPLDIHSPAVQGSDFQVLPGGEALAAKTLYPVSFPMAAPLQLVAFFLRRTGNKEQNPERKEEKERGHRATAASASFPGRTRKCASKECLWHSQPLLAPPAPKGMHANSTSL